MSKSFKRTGVLATALAAALATLPLASPPAQADPPRWAPAYGYRAQERHHKFERREHRDDWRRWSGHEHYRTVYVVRPAYRYSYERPYRHDRRYDGADLSISPSVGGAILGAVIGGLGGSQIGKGSGRTAAIIGGIAAGAVIGGSIGKSMEAADAARVQQTLETTRTGQTVVWQNPQTGNRYEMTPTRTYRSNSRDCREYTSWVLIGGYEEQVSGTACRMPDGSWQRQNS